MDQQYGSNGASNVPTTSSYSSLPSIAPQQLQQNASLPPHTLPPLQAQHAAISMHSMYNQQPLSAPHTPTSTQPNTPGSTGNGGFQQMGGQPPQRAYHLQQSSSYQQPLQPYGNTSSMMPQTSGSMSHQHPQAIAPAPGPNQRGLVPLRMGPSGPMQGHHPMHQPMHPGIGQQYNGLARDEVPTHVVGSQGRRGILPSAPGRPAVTATGPGASKNTLIPAKDADGKFPCPHCVKTYLHAKHLKRHLLRHTGDRPYMCVLCRDTFSRSDILKRHFQKCSIRRGNPTGASHLSHAQAHLKKNQPQKPLPPAPEGEMMRNMNGMNGGPTDPQLQQFGMMPDGRGPPHMSDDQLSQAHLSRASSIKHMENNDGRDRRSMTGPTPSGSSRASFDQNYNNDIPSTMSSLNPQLAAYNMPQNGYNGAPYGQHHEYTSQSNGSSMHPAANEEMSAMSNGRGPMPVYGAPSNGQQSNLDWAHMFHTGAQDNGFMGPYHSSLVQNQMAIKAEPSSLPQSNDNVYSNGMYSGQAANAHGSAVHSNGNAGNFPSWNFAAQQNPFNQISNQLVSFCCPASHLAQANNIRLCLSPDNIKHFLEQYTNFQGHFPMIHMPTFSIENAYQGLLLAMICIGAVYSDRIRPNQVRELMEHTRSAIERDSRVLHAASQDREIKMEEPSGPSKTELEEIQAVVLMQILFTFHGTPIQREMARRKYPALRKISEMMRLNQPTTTAPAMSLLHQPNVDTQHCNAASFDWTTWVEQEKRSRLFYVIYLLDSAMVIYFNNNPLFDPNEITLPLPADDSAWEAWSSTLCAEALGLHGAVVAKEKNPDGSRRAKQPEMNSALRALVDPQASLKAGTTNVFSKFILIHALLVQLWCRQKQAKQETDSASSSRNASNQPSPKNGEEEQKVEVKVESAAATPSGEKTVEISPQLKAQISNLSAALDKWKRTWDDDIATQYPPSSRSYRRFGFCRDGIHFFYLAKYLMKIGNDYREAPDKRFTRVIHLLKSVKDWVVSDSAQRNEELGSVGDIDQGYGATDLTLDMAQFFKPFNRQIHSPIAGVHTNIGMGNGNGNGNGAGMMG